MKSRNVIFDGDGRKIKNRCELKMEFVPEPGKGEILCKALYSLISVGSETTQWRNILDPAHHWVEEVAHDFHPGYSMTAEVIQVGEDVTDISVGDKVYCGIQHREYFIVSAENVHIIPEGVSPQEAAWSTVLRAGINSMLACHVTFGDTVVILGQGILGMSVLQFAKLSGALTIIVADPIKVRAERAWKYGATHVFNCKGQEIIDEVRKINGGELADVAIDATASPEGLAAACELTKAGGHIALIADPARLSEQCPGGNICLGYQTIHGIFISSMGCKLNPFYPLDDKKAQKVLFTYMQQRKINVKELITDVVSPVNAAEVYERLYDCRDETLGVMYDWSLLEKERE